MQERYTPAVPTPLDGATEARLVLGLLRSGAPPDGDFTPAKPRPSEFFAAICTRPPAGAQQAELRQRCMPLSDIPLLINNLEGTKDVFVSQAAYFRPNRRKASAASAALLFVDLDFDRLAPSASIAASSSPSEQALAVVDWLTANHVPAPSYVIHSGRGLHLKWLIERLPRRALGRWQSVMNALVSRLAPIGADPNAKDVSRILRTIGSLHGTTATRVREVWRNANKIGGIREYSFDDLAASVLPVSRDTVRANKAAAKKRRRDKSGTKRKGRRGALYALWHPRKSDLDQLTSMRGWDVTGIPDGHRVAFMLVYAVALSYLHSGRAFHARLSEAAARLVPHWSSRKLAGALCNVLAAAGTRNQLRFSTAAIVARLTVTTLEQERLTALRVHADPVARRNQLQRSRRRAIGTRSQESIASARSEKANLVSRMRAEGASWAVVCETAGVSRSTANRLLALASDVSSVMHVRVAKPEEVCGSCAPPERPRGPGVGNTRLPQPTLTESPPRRPGQAYPIGYPHFSRARRFTR